MAQTLLTHAQMISNLIGDYTASENPELFKAGFNFVADLIPADSMLWASPKLRELTFGSDGHTIHGSHWSDDPETYGMSLKIISVWRHEANTDSHRKCREVTQEELLAGADVNSLYFNRTSSKDPVYSIDKDGLLKVYPDPDNASQNPHKLKYWNYEHWDKFSSESNNQEYFSYHINNDLFGFPKEAQLLATIKSAMNILQVKMGISVHDDEDPELLGLQQTQMQQLQQWFESEASRLNIKWRTLGVEEG